MVLLPFYEMNRRAEEEELKQKIAKLDEYCHSLEEKKRERRHRLENVRLRAEIARLKGDKQATARLDVEAMSLKVELEDIEQQMAITTKKVEKKKAKLGGGSPFPIPFWLLPIA